MLEAMVAMAVLSAALLPLLALQGQFVRSVSQMDVIEQRLAIQSIFSSTISSTNLMEVQQGAFEIEGAQVTWKAQQILPIRTVRDYSGLTSRYSTAYYNVQARVKSQSGQISTLQTRGMGWKETRSILTEF